MKRIGLVAAVCAAVALAAGTAAVALEEQKAPVAQPDGAPQAGVQDGATAAGTTPDAGTEIRIPGLGKLGTLPKMDFGLELLYGAADGSAALQEQTPSVETPPEDLTVRGSVKHRF